ncbi:MAG: VWA domain-containing protein [Actinomycetota bacterium]
MTVTGQEPLAAERSIETDPTPTLWIPDSSVWAAMLGATPALSSAVTIGNSIATSPLVLAAAPGKATALAATAKAGWAAGVIGKVRVAICDPTISSTGALTALALQAQTGTAPGASAALVGQFARLAASRIASPAAGLANLQAHPATAPALVASERDVFAGNQGKPTAVATAVYPAGATPVLDFPVVTVAPAGADQVLVAVATLFAQQLATPNAQRQFTAAGLRDPAGTPLPIDSGSSGIASQIVTAAPAPDAAKLAETARLWKAAAKPSHLLAVMDVSGSMRDPAGNGQSKIAIAAAAAQSAIALMPDGWTVGLWSFSIQAPPLTDWTELVPLGKVRAQRTSLQTAAGTLPSRVSGNSGLYDTALAAFEQVTRSYDPSSVNVVALLTDGTNLDSDGIDLATLLGKLKTEFNPERPVTIVTIGVGPDADASALEQIAAATMGRFYSVKDPANIRGVLLDSIIVN